MKISRRKFVGALSASAGIAFVFKQGILGQVTIVPPVDDGSLLAKMNFLTFFENLNTEFLFLNEDRVQVPLRLVSVTDSRPIEKSKWGQGQENFVLKFLGPRRFPLKQATYQVEHFALGAFELFITEGGTDKSGRAYIAVINRVVS